KGDDPSPAERWTASHAGRNRRDRPSSNLLLQVRDRPRAKILVQNVPRICRHARRVDAGEALFGRRKGLIAVGQRGRTLDDDEGTIQRLMAAVAACGELVEGVCEGRAVLGLDRLLESSDPGPDGLLHRVAAEPLVDIIETFFQLVD